MMMTNLFLAVFEISISISALIAVLLLLTPFLNRRYAVKWKYWIWIFLALRLIIPFSAADMKTLVNPWTQAGGRVASGSVKSDVDNLPKQAAPQGRVVLEIPARMTAPIGAASEKGNITLLDIVAFVWMMGGLTFIAVHMTSYACYRWWVLKRGTVVRDNDILRQVFRLKHELRIKDTVHIMEYPEAASPMVVGFLEPVLILPEVRYSSEELYFILKHELVHLKRRDVYMKLLLVAANAVHWFNPFIWIMQKEATVDMELSCDERVTQGTDYEVRKAYTETLLSTLHKRCAGRTVLSTQFYGGKQVVKKRFKNILIRTGKKNGAVIFMCAVMLTASVGTLAGCSFTRGGSGQAENGNTAGQTGNAEGDPGRSEGGDSQTTQGTDGRAGEGNSQSAQAAGANDSNTGNGSSARPAGNRESTEILVYIEKLDGETLAFDEVEWVQVPGERAVELGLTEDDAPSGFSVYNEDIVTEEMSLADGCVCTLLDWTSNYVKMQVTPEELADILAEREGTAIPYRLTIEGNEIMGITEKYVP